MKMMFRMLLVVLLCSTSMAYAKDVAVLLPLTGPLTPFEKSELTREAVETLAVNFDLRHGEEVDRFVKQAFQEESKKIDCDETNCYRRIAKQYQAEKIIALRVTQAGKGRYLVTYHLYDVPTGEMVATRQNECISCSFDKLKALCKELTRQK